MARRSQKSGLSPSELHTKLEAGDVDPLYLFLGPERLLRRRAVEELVSRVDESFRAFNVDRVSAVDTPFEQALDMAMQVPMMAARRLVVVTEAESIKDTAQDRLEAYLKDPSPQATVVFASDALDMRRKTATALSKACTVVRFDPLSEADALRWIEARALELGARIDRQAAGALVDLAGTDLTRLSGELGKLAAWAAGGAISVQPVLDLVSRAREHEIWDLTDAMLARDRRRALRVVRRQLDAGEEPLGLLGVLASTYRKMLLASELMTRRAPMEEVQAAVKLPPWKMGEFNTGVRAIPVDRIVHGILRMAEVDLAIKSSIGTPALQLEVLVCELTL